MKKFIFSIFFFSLMIVGAEAQKASCAKTCTKSASTAAACQSKAPGVATTSTIPAEYATAAAKLASLDASIESRTNTETGHVTYVRKETCAGSGTVSYVDLGYDATSNTFVNVSPMKMEGTPTGSGCSSKATSASGKACCAKGVADGKACCAGKNGAVKTAEKVKS